MEGVHDAMAYVEAGEVVSIRMSDARRLRSR